MTYDGYMTQQERVAQALRLRPSGVCATDFLAMRIPRYSALIHKLRNAGVVIVTEPCSNHLHEHSTRQVQFRVQQPEGTLF